MKNNNNFKNNLEFSEKMQRHLYYFYKEKAFAGRFVFANKEFKKEKSFLQENGIDSVLQLINNNYILVEEKFVTCQDNFYKRICVETESCTIEGYKSKGWIYKIRANYLLYAMIYEKDIYKKLLFIFNVEQLKKYFFDDIDNFETYTMPEENKTKSSLVPIKDIIENGIETYIYYQDGLVKFRKFDNNEFLKYKYFSDFDNSIKKEDNFELDF